METVFITGGAGFIGSRLTGLLAQRYRVVAYDSLLPQVHEGNPDNRARFEAAGGKLIQGDIRDRAALQDALAQVAPAIVVHLASETGTGQSYDFVGRYCEVNVGGTANLVEAIRAVGSVRRVLLASSRAVYGEGACVGPDGRPAAAVERRPADIASGDYAPHDATGLRLSPVPTDAVACPVAPTSIYASTKLMQEFLLRQAFWGTPVGVGVLRMQNVFGEGQSLNNPYTGVLSIFVRQIQEGLALRLYEDGNAVRDFIHVDDVARAFLALAEVPQLPERAIDIGSGETVSLLDVSRRLLALLGAAPDRFEITGEFRPGDIRHAVADISAARTMLGWRPQVSLEAGLQRLVEWSRVPAV
ncbi:NAD-dependent epimerase/dehydratase family protein [Vannielia sp. SX4]|uniref:NAD-dependent epimerase/dehydratase family protein n=1 Tax=Vannielia sp. SX4 TaxID=3463852 RepID=UPI00405987B4